MTQHPVDALEALLDQGRAIQWEVERKPGRIWVSIAFLEFDADSPKGVCNVVHGYGPFLGDAVQEAIRKLPAVTV